MNLRTARQPYRRTVSPRVPVVLPTVRVEVHAGGSLDVVVEGDPDAGATARNRDELPRIVDEIATRNASPVRVEIREADGTLYTDIAMPDTRSTAADEGAAAGQESGSPGEVGGRGFLPQEEVAVAVVVSTQVAADDGTARVRVPPALLNGIRGDVLLLGRSSGTVAVREAI